MKKKLKRKAPSKVKPVKKVAAKKTDLKRSKAVRKTITRKNTNKKIVSKPVKTIKKTKPSVSKKSSYQKTVKKKSKPSNISLKKISFLDKNKHFIPYFVIFTIFAAFVLALSIFSDLDGNDVSITGNAILDIGKLNPGFSFGMLVIISVYAFITCSYLNYRNKK